MMRNHIFKSEILNLANFIQRSFKQSSTPGGYCSDSENNKYYVKHPKCNHLINTIIAHPIFEQFLWLYSNARNKSCPRLCN